MEESKLKWFMIESDGKWGETFNTTWTPIEVASTGEAKRAARRLRKFPDSQLGIVLRDMTNLRILMRYQLMVNNKWHRFGNYT